MIKKRMKIQKINNMIMIKIQDLQKKISDNSNWSTSLSTCFLHKEGVEYIINVRIRKLYNFINKYFIFKICHILFYKFNFNNFIIFN